MRCMRVCPTEAIRIREGKALILGDRCIDCGDCIRVCPKRAIRSITGSYEDLSKYKYTIAIPSPSLYAQYGMGVTPNHILNGLKGLAFNEAYWVASDLRVIVPAAPVVNDPLAVEVQARAVVGTSYEGERL